METERTYSAFEGHTLIASGEVKTVVLGTKDRFDRNQGAALLIFEDQTGAQIDFDLAGTPDEVIARLANHPMFASSASKTVERAGPGRPKLGVTSREISLLPRHWEWLDQQPGGVSVALRKLVEEARKRGQGKAQARTLRDAAGKFMWAMAGNLPDFEEASRALYASDLEKLEALIAPWPEDLRKHIERLMRESVRLEKLDDAAVTPA